MDLFTYLMAKNGNNTSVHGDLFSYLLGKGQSQTYTVSGTTIYIPDAKKLVSFMMTKESTQETTTGKNLFDKSKATNGRMINKDTGNPDIDASTTCSDFINVKGLNSIILSGTSISYGNGGAFYDENKTYISGFNSVTIKSGITIPNNVVYVRFNLLPANINTTQLEKGTTATAYEEYTGGQPSPSPEFPQSVKTVKGYRNLLNINSPYIKRNDYGSISISNNVISVTNGTTTHNAYGWIIPVEIGKEMTVSFEEITASVSFANVYYKFLDSPISSITNFDDSVFVPRAEKYITFTTTKSYLLVYIRVPQTSFSVTGLMVTYSDNILPYVPYGNNYVAVNVSDGNTTNNYPIPLNNNEIVGIGNYKDELKIDKSGHVYINKKTLTLNPSDITSIITYGTGTSNYFYRLLFSVDKSIDSNSSLCTHYKNTSVTTSNTNQGFHNYENEIRVRYGEEQATTIFGTWLEDNNVTFYLPRKTPELIDLQTTVDLSLFKGVNNVSNSEDGYMTIEYR